MNFLTSIFYLRCEKLGNPISAQIRLCGRLLLFVLKGDYNLPTAISGNKKGEFIMKVNEILLRRKNLIFVEDCDITFDNRFKMPKAFSKEFIEAATVVSNVSTLGYFFFRFCI